MRGSKSLKRGNPSKRVGRSIEEVLVRRQFDGSDPITWPDGTTFNQFPRSQNSLPNLQHNNSNAADNERAAFRRPSSRGQHEAQKNSSSGNFLAEYSDEDKMKMMESLVKYTRALQSRVEVKKLSNHPCNLNTLNRDVIKVLFFYLDQDLETQLSRGGSPATLAQLYSANSPMPVAGGAALMSDAFGQQLQRQIFAHKTITHSKAAMAADLAAQALNAVGTHTFQRSSLSHGVRGGVADSMFGGYSASVRPRIILPSTTTFDYSAMQPSQCCRYYC